MTKGTVSVLIPVYNAEATLPKCLDSVCGQTYKELEILLVDDGSNDSSLEICQRYAQQDPRIVLHVQANGGPSAARNKALDMATGDYLVFVDSDDYVEPDMVARMVDKAEENAVDMVICNFLEEKEDAVRQHVFSHRGGYYGQDACRNVALDFVDNNTKTRIPPYSCIRMIRRDTFEKMGLRFDAKVKRSEDYLLWTQVHFQIKSMYLMADAWLYHYVNNASSITNTYLPGYWTMCKLLYARLNQVLPQDKDVKKRLQAMLIQRSLIAIHNAEAADARQFRQDVEEILNDKELIKAAWAVGLVKNSKRARIYALLVMLRQKWLVKKSFKPRNK